MRKLKSSVKSYIVIGVLIIATVIAALSAVLIIKQRERASKGITLAEVSKLITGVYIDVKDLPDDDDKNWYDKYIRYVNENGYMSITNPEEYLNYGELKHLLEFYNKKPDDYGFDNSSKDSSMINKNDFINCYIELLKLIDKDKKVGMITTGLIATPSNIEGLNSWEAVTNDGRYSFEGLSIDSAIDHEAVFIVRDKEILAMQRITDNEFVYHNAWIVKYENKKLEAYIEGIHRTFSIGGLDGDAGRSIADISAKAGKITSVNVKKDTITGKILAVTDKYVEIEGYGKVEFDPDYKIYDICDDVIVKDYNSIVVGYSLQDFVVGNGMIAGAVIQRPLEADNIRVLLMDSGYNSLYHDSVSVTSDAAFTITNGDNVVDYNANEIVTLNTSSDWSNGRYVIRPSETGYIKVLSIDRRQGNPEYDGVIEIDRSDLGLTIVNDISIELYLKRVVPSEMPTSYGVEALKVQAVCARSYAYMGLSNYSYAQYGAHIDDSTLFQVYNNTVETAESNQAVDDTRGQILTYNDNPVQAFYYSTSCGYSTDVGLWGTDTANYPYYVAQSISSSANAVDLTNEENFRTYIMGRNQSDFDYGYTYYRWQLDTDIASFSQSFNNKMLQRAKTYPDNILFKQSDGSFSSKNAVNIGNVTNIISERRSAGGALTSIIVEGTAGSVKIQGENNIRAICGMSNVTMLTSNGEQTTMSSLPSTFCIFDIDSDKIIINGGGFGHGIGMSQNAAYSMTKKRYNYEEILAFFYKNTVIKKVYN